MILSHKYKLCKDKVQSFGVNKKYLRCETFITVANELSAFECCLFQPIWVLQSGDIAIFPRQVKIPIVPLFAECDSKLTITLISFIDLHESNSNRRGNVHHYTLLSMCYTYI